jgi:predicted  nucleic acid-binding Zn-ribbon protein
MPPFQGGLGECPCPRSELGWSEGHRRMHELARRMHSHRCPRCGTRWKHGDESFDNPRAHACPKCGRIQWMKEMPTMQGLGQIPPQVIAQQIDMAKLAFLGPLLVAVYEAREKAAPEIERGYQMAQGGFVPRTQMSVEKANLQMIMAGIPPGSAGFPDGVPGFVPTAMKILGISIPRDADTSTQTGALFRKAQADIDWWINRATEAQKKAGLNADAGPNVFTDATSTFFSWVDAMEKNAPKIVEKVKEAAAGAGAAGTNLVKTAESLARSARSGARQVRKLPGYAKIALLGGGVIALGLFALAALYIATRKK